MGRRRRPATRRRTYLLIRFWFPRTKPSHAKLAIHLCLDLCGRCDRSVFVRSRCVASERLERFGSPPHLSLPFLLFSALDDDVIVHVTVLRRCEQSHGVVSLSIPAFVRPASSPPKRHHPSSPARTHPPIHPSSPIALSPTSARVRTSYLMT